MGRLVLAEGTEAGPTRLSFFADHFGVIEVDNTVYGEYKERRICVTGKIRRVPGRSGDYR